MLVNVYFYPGWGIVENPKEWEIIKSAQPFFDGHKPTNTPMFPDYSVSDHNYILRLIKFCEIYKIDSITICWYWDNQKEIWNDFLDAFINIVTNRKLKFSLMWVQRKPYKKFPLKVFGKEEIYEPESDERNISISYEDNNKIANDILKYFNHPNYLKIDNKYCFTIFEVKNLIRDLGVSVNDFFNNFRKVIRDYTNAEILLLGVSHHVNDLYPLHELGFDYTTSYVFLPDWEKPNIYDYNETMKDRINDIETIESKTQLNYIPSIACGWDASSRGCSNENLPTYPWYPIIINNNPLVFLKYLQIAKKQAIEKDLPFINVASMNEWSENHSIEPSLEFGFGYLEAIRHMKSNYYKTSVKDKIFLFTDIDGTIIDSEGKLKAGFDNLITKKRNDILLVYVTARTMADTIHSIIDNTIPEPDFIIADVGTSFVGWELKSKLNHPFSETLKSFPKSEIEIFISQIEGIEIQNIAANYRVSCNIDATVIDKKHLTEMILEQSFGENIDILFSKNFVDILPKKVNKKTLVESIIANYHTNQKIIVAGDSLNDQHLFIKNYSNSITRICVPNSDAELFHKISNYSNSVIGELDHKSLNE